MKLYKYLLILLAGAFVIIVLQKINLSSFKYRSDNLITVDPAQQFLQASSHLPNDFEYYYDVYRFINALDAVFNRRCR